MFGSILLAALGIGFLIFVHEAGHFLAARLAGVRVEVFSLGFGPRLFGVVWRGTDFRLSLVPFGGYVMVAGQDPNDRRYPARESLWAKTVGQRALFWSGGVLMNLLFALIAFPLVFRAGVAFPAPVIGRVATGGAAWEAGLQPGERIVAIGGKKVRSFDNLVVEAALVGGRNVDLLVRAPDGAERTVTVLPQWNPTGGIYELGIGEATVPALPTLGIQPRSAAAAAGLQDGDVLLEVDGTPPLGAAFDRFVETLQRGDAVPLSLRVRSSGADGGAASERTVTVTPRPVEDVPERIGVELLPRQVVGLRQGSAIVERLALRRGDVLLALDGVPFTSGVLDTAATGPETLRVHVARGGEQVVLEAAASAADRAAFVRDVVLTTDDSLMLLPRPGLPAAEVGMRAGDRIVAVRGSEIRSFQDLRKAVESCGGEPLPIVVQRARTAPGTSVFDPVTRDLPLPERVELTIKPRRPQQFATGLVPRLAHVTEEVRAGSFGEALQLGTSFSLDLIKQLYVTLKRMVTGDVGAKNLGGIIRIGQVSYEAAQRGPSWFFYLLAMLSLNLAFVNLLPIPVLDGGHLTFLLIEKVKGSPVSARVFGYSQVVGLVFVLMLVLFVTYNDILRLL
jgi:regulator of sigma E protease